jgi:hypothetical protein
MFHFHRLAILTGEPLHISLREGLSLKRKECPRCVFCGTPV